ncbi:hypothetical protein CHS0354_010773 [Potamilus streckersoni]|uniref:Uncharacterized protein n=1 Tax=Potamilus streckersoni TaxID=2493646 RepID=A0AAE0TAD4_9BIVA|nr:hypothetical protein CHS0354_010773 [Potamilus streckersoni]
MLLFIESIRWSKRITKKDRVDEKRREMEQMEDGDGWSRWKTERGGRSSQMSLKDRVDGERRRME